MGRYSQWLGANRSYQEKVTRRLIPKIKALVSHHFSKTELTIEKIVIIVVVCTMLALATWAAEVLLPVQVNIVRCVTQEERIRMCNERSLCCNLVDEEAGRNVSRPAGEGPPRTRTDFAHEVFE